MPLLRAICRQRRCGTPPHRWAWLRQIFSDVSKQIRFAFRSDWSSVSVEHLPERSNWRGSEPSTLENHVYVWCYTLIVMHARNEWMNVFIWMNTSWCCMCVSVYYRRWWADGFAAEAHSLQWCQGQSQWAGMWLVTVKSSEYFNWIFYM